MRTIITLLDWFVRTMQIIRAHIFRFQNSLDFLKMTLALMRWVSQTSSLTFLSQTLIIFLHELNDFIFNNIVVLPASIVNDRSKFILVNRVRWDILSLELRGRNRLRTQGSGNRLQKIKIAIFFRNFCHQGNTMPLIQKYCHSDNGISSFPASWIWQLWINFCGYGNHFSRIHHFHVFRLLRLQYVLHFTFYTVQDSQSYTTLSDSSQTHTNIWLIPNLAIFWQLFPGVHENAEKIDLGLELESRWRNSLQCVLIILRLSSFPSVIINFPQIRTN